MLSIIVGGSVAAPAIAALDSWRKPVVQAVLLPAHAQNSSTLNAELGSDDPVTTSTAQNAATPGAASATPGTASATAGAASTDPNLLTCSNDPTIVCFRDNRFKDAVLGSYRVSAKERSTTIDGEILVSEALATKEISVAYGEITDLTGLEEFSNISWLDVSNNELTALDISQNTKVTRLDCYSNKLTTLDLSHNSELTSVRCYFNPLTSIDVSKNTKLEGLLCAKTELTTLDVSKNPNLLFLTCVANPSLRYIVVADVNNIPSGWHKDATAEYVEAIPPVSFADSNFKAALVGNSAINTNGNTEIELFEAQAFSGGINMWFLYLSNTQGLEAFTGLTRLSFRRNRSLTTLDLSSNTALTELYCMNNRLLTTLDVSKNVELTSLDFSHTPLTSIDLSHNTALTSLELSSNSITNLLTTLDISQNTALTRLVCFGSGLTTLDISQNTALTYLDCRHTAQLTTLDVSKNTALTDLRCNNNRLRYIVVSSAQLSNIPSNWQKDSTAEYVLEVPTT